MRSANQEYQSCKGTVILSELTFDYFKKVVTIPLLDHLTAEIESIFDHASISVYSDLINIPSKMVSLVHINVNWKEKFNIFADLFKDVPKRWRQNWTYGKHIG